MPLSIGSWSSVRAKITSDVQLLRVQAEAERARAYISVFDAQTRAYEANLRRLIDSARLKVELYNADISLDRVINDATVAKAQLQSSLIQATVQANVSLDQVQIANARAKVEAAIAGVNFQTKAAEFGSQQFFAVLTALENQLNVLTVQSSTGP